MSKQPKQDMPMPPGQDHVIMMPANPRHGKPPVERPMNPTPMPKPSKPKPKPKP